MSTCVYSVWGGRIEEPLHMIWLHTPALEVLSASQ